MRAIAIGLMLSFATAAAWAQRPAPPTKTFSSAEDVAGLLAKAKADHKDGQPTVIERILTLAPYGVNLEYRTAVGPAAVHPREAELFYVLDGSGTLTTGGKLIDAKDTNPDNITGTGIDGGSSRHMSKGDVAIVPENTPHWFSSIDGTIVLMSMHVPRSAGGTH